jgi:RimJ/RimL family protein N-acetyltransferase
MTLDERGRIANRWGITIAAALDGQLLFVGSQLDAQLASELEEAFDAAPYQEDFTSPPAALVACERLLHDAGAGFRRTGGPYYLVPAGTRFGSAAQITVSTSRAVDAHRSRNPGNWAPDEWDQLLDGRLGPWAIATIDRRVVSICHTPRVMTDRAAECGVWTDPDFRGHGHAAAVTAAWATMLEPTGRYLFYSTDATNRSSRQVAARLNLRLLGWTWNLVKPRDETQYQRHPLSTP